MARGTIEGRVEFLPLPTRGPFRSDKEILWGKIANLALDGALACLSLDLQDQWESSQVKKEREEIERRLEGAFYLCGVIIEGPQMKDKPIRSIEQCKRIDIYDSLLVSIVGGGKPFSSEPGMVEWAKEARHKLDQIAKSGSVSESDRERFSDIQEKFTEIAGVYVYKQGM